MKKSGNGSWNKQYFYCLINIPFFWVIKVGITSKPAARIKQIDKSSKGKDYYLFKHKVWAAYYWEQLHHKLLFLFKNNSFDGSGKTERFWIFALPFSIIIFLLSVLVDMGLYVIVAMLVVYLIYIFY